MHGHSEHLHPHAHPELPMNGYAVTGVAVHAIGAAEFCWVFLASSDDSSRYAELPGDDECYPSKDSALIAAYLAFRKRLRAGAR
jgi:hypothetical protein